MIQSQIWLILFHTMPFCYYNADGMIKKKMKLTSSSINATSVWLASLQNNYFSDFPESCITIMVVF